MALVDYILGGPRAVFEPEIKAGLLSEVPGFLLRVGGALASTKLKPLRLPRPAVYSNHRRLQGYRSGAKQAYQLLTLPGPGTNFKFVTVSASSAVTLLATRMRGAANTYSTPWFKHSVSS